MKKLMLSIAAMLFSCVMLLGQDCVPVPSDTMKTGRVGAWFAIHHHAVVSLLKDREVKPLLEAKIDTLQSQKMRLLDEYRILKHNKSLLLEADAESQKQIEKLLESLQEQQAECDKAIRREKSKTKLVSLLGVVATASILVLVAL